MIISVNIYSWKANLTVEVITLNLKFSYSLETLGTNNYTLETFH